jgi:Holliday junction resolvasome RuvABC endonuclease subunit
MKILSIDPGLANLGWISLNRGQDGGLGVVDGGVICTAKRTKAQARKLGAETVSASNMRRTRELTAQIAPLFFGSEILIIEAQSSPRSSSSASKTAYSRGALIALATLAGLQVYEVQPKALKTALTGSQSASKGEVETAVLEQLPELGVYLDSVTKMRREHLADAAGAALAWMS